MTHEEWRWIPGLEGQYQASNLGRIRSFLRGRIRILAAADGGNGYESLHVRSRGSVPVHVLVCETFHGPKADGQETRHLDGNRKNNTPENLAWGTRTENMSDTIRNGRIQAGERHAGTHLSEAQVCTMREKYAAGTSSAALADEFDTSQNAVYHICTGRTWKHSAGPITNRATWKKYDPETLEKIRADRAAGMTYAVLCAKYGISVGWLSEILAKPDVAARRRRRRTQGACSPHELGIRVP